MKKGNSKPLTQDDKDQLSLLEAMGDADIDLTEMPEVTDWTGFQRGVHYRPIKKLYSIRLDTDLVAWFKDAGDGYQTRINAALREYIEGHKAKSA